MIEIWGKPACSFCTSAKNLCEELDFQYRYLQLDEDYTMEELWEQVPGFKTFPQIFVDGISVGGYREFGTWVDELTHGT